MNKSQCWDSWMEGIHGDLQCANSLQEQVPDSSFNLSLLLPKCAMRPLCASWCISGGDGFVCAGGKSRVCYSPQSQITLREFPTVPWELGGKGQPAWFGVLRGQGRICFEVASAKAVPKSQKNVGRASLCPILYSTDFSSSIQCS